MTFLPGYSMDLLTVGLPARPFRSRRSWSWDVFAADAAGTPGSGQRGCRRGTTAGSDLVDADVVLWHVFGPTHVPRPEDWPVMPVAHRAAASRLGSIADLLRDCVRRGMRAPLLAGRRRRARVLALRKVIPDTREQRC